MRLIDADRLLEVYDQIHIGPPGNARIMIMTAPTVMEWVSVEDRMPEEGTWVLVCEKDGCMFIDVRDDGEWRIGVQALAVITHWMPLPEPPGGKDGKTC